MPYPGFHNKRNAPKEDKPARAPKPDTAGQTENFFTANVKLITFIVTLAVLIIPAAIWSVGRVNRWYDSLTGKDLIPISEMDALIERGPALTWADFEDYDGEVIMESLTYICQYDVEGGRYYFLVSSAKEGAQVESVIFVDQQSDKGSIELIPEQKDEPVTQQ